MTTTHHEVSCRIMAGDKCDCTPIQVEDIRKLRVIVTGGRDWRDVDAIRQALSDLPPGSTIVHGAASGADAIAHSLAVALGHIPEPHWPDYANIGTGLAPLIRNQQMIDLGADLCLAFPTAFSRGTWHCVRAAEKAEIETRVFSVDLVKAPS